MSTLVSVCSEDRCPPFASVDDVGFFEEPPTLSLFGFFFDGTLGLGAALFLCLLPAPLRDCDFMPLPRPAVFPAVIVFIGFQCWVMQ